MTTPCDAPYPAHSSAHDPLCLGRRVAAPRAGPQDPPLNYSDPVRYALNIRLPALVESIRTVYEVLNSPRFWEIMVLGEPGVSVSVLPGFQVAHILLQVVHLRAQRANLAHQVALNLTLFGFNKHGRHRGCHQRQHR